MQTTILNFDENGRKGFLTGRKHCGKRRNCSLLVLHKLVLQTRKNQGLFGKGLKKANVGIYKPTFLVLEDVQPQHNKTVNPFPNDKLLTLSN